MKNYDAKTKQMADFAAVGFRLSSAADSKIKSSETVNRKIDDIQEEIMNLLRISSFEGMTTADLMLTIQSADLNDHQVMHLHQLLQVHHALGEELVKLTAEIRKITDQTKTIAFMMQIMNEI